VRVGDDRPVTQTGERQNEPAALRRQTGQAPGSRAQASTAKPPRRAGRSRRVGVWAVVLIVLVDLVWHAGLTSLSFLILLLLAAGGLAATVNWAWNRWPARGAL